MNIIGIMGPPLSGKSTLARHMAERFDWLHISSDNIARSIAKNDTKVADGLQRGDLADPRIFDRRMVRYLDGIRNAYGDEPVVLDGYPRYWEQFADIATFLRLGPRNMVFVDIFASKSMLEDRRAERLTAEARADDTEEAFQRRYEIWQQQTRPLVTYLRQRGLIIGEPMVGPGTNMDGVADALRAHALVHFGTPSFLAGPV